MCAKTCGILTELSLLAVPQAFPHSSLLKHIIGVNAVSTGLDLLYQSDPMPVMGAGSLNHAGQNASLGELRI